MPFQNKFVFSPISSFFCSPMSFSVTLASIQTGKSLHNVSKDGDWTTSQDLEPLQSCQLSSTPTEKTYILHSIQLERATQPSEEKCTFTDPDQKVPRKICHDQRLNGESNLSTSVTRLEGSLCLENQKALHNNDSAIPIILKQSISHLSTSCITFNVESCALLSSDKQTRPGNLEPALYSERCRTSSTSCQNANDLDRRFSNLETVQAVLEESFDSNQFTNNVLCTETGSVIATEAHVFLTSMTKKPNTPNAEPACTPTATKLTDLGQTSAADTIPDELQ